MGMKDRFPLLYEELSKTHTILMHKGSSDTEIWTDMVSPGWMDKEEFCKQLRAYSNDIDLDELSVVSNRQFHSRATAQAWIDAVLAFVGGEKPDLSQVLGWRH